MRSPLKRAEEILRRIVFPGINAWATQKNVRSHTHDQSDDSTGIIDFDHRAVDACLFRGHGLLLVSAIRDNAAMEREDSRDWLAKLDLTKIILFPGVTEPEIAVAEREIGLRLPNSHREFLQVSNGVIARDIILYSINETNSSVGPGIVVLDRLTHDTCNGRY